jgi:hypothetical protein
MAVQLASVFIAPEEPGGPGPVDNNDKAKQAKTLISAKRHDRARLRRMSLRADLAKGRLRAAAHHEGTGLRAFRRDQTRNRVDSVWGREHVASERHSVGGK